MRRPEVTAPDAQRILALLNDSLEMYRTLGAQGDALYGQALAHTLFTLNQQVNPVGLFGTFTGKVTKFKNHALCEMFVFTRIKEEDIPAAFALYAQWRLGLARDLDLEWLKSVLCEAIARLPWDRREDHHRNARQERVEWLSLVDDSAWEAPHNPEPLSLAGEAI